MQNSSLQLCRVLRPADYSCSGNYWFTVWFTDWFTFHDSGGALLGGVPGKLADRSGCPVQHYGSWIQLPGYLPGSLRRRFVSGHVLGRWQWNVGI